MLESQLGEVSIYLNCKVGRVLPPPPTIPIAPAPAVRKYRSPSYHRDRRQECRKASQHEASIADQVNEELNIITSELFTDVDETII